jgi:hypothetical protein
VSAFGGNVIGPLLGARASAPAHHRGAVTAIVDGWIRFGRWYAGRLPGWRCPHQRAVVADTILLDYDQQGGEI